MAPNPRCLPFDSLQKKIAHPMLSIITINILMYSFHFFVQICIFCFLNSTNQVVSYSNAVLQPTQGLAVSLCGPAHLSSSWSCWLWVSRGRWPGFSCRWAQGSVNYAIRVNWILQVQRKAKSGWRKQDRVHGTMPLGNSELKTLRSFRAGTQRNMNEYGWCPGGTKFPDSLWWAPYLGASLGK